MISTVELQNTVPPAMENQSGSPSFSSTTLFEEYHLLVESAMLIQCTNAILSVRGKDSLDFLQRLSTNELKAISEHQFVTTILVTEKAKVVDVATVIRKNEEFLMILQSVNAGIVLKWLEKFLFTEDVHLRNVTGEYEHFAVVGERAEQIVSKFSEQAQDGITFQDSLWGERMVHCLVRHNQKREVNSELFSYLGTVGNESDAFESYRIENGVPKFGFELTEHINPLEAGLERFISWTKGCYIGQEVVARIDTYKKLQRRLVGFIFDDEGRNKVANGKIFFEGEEVGWTTSHAWSEKFRKHIALGYLKTSVESDVLQFQNEQIKESIPVRVSTLPFDIQ
ncbi:MAG: aminomethyl transferase family protein [Ignavibacteriae bacterium]|nr:aminomethyl transferase family protein [Ignavibacteriota bacterium]